MQIGDSDPITYPYHNNSVGICIMSRGAAGCGLVDNTAEFNNATETPEFQRRCHIPQKPKVSV